MIMSQQVLLGCRAFSAVAIRLQRDCVVVVDATLSLRGHLQKIEHRRICGGDSISADVTTPIRWCARGGRERYDAVSMTQLRAVNGWLVSRCIHRAGKIRRIQACVFVRSPPWANPSAICELHKKISVFRCVPLNKTWKFYHFLSIFCSFFCYSEIRHMEASGMSRRAN